MADVVGVYLAFSWHSQPVTKPMDFSCLANWGRKKHPSRIPIIRFFSIYLFPYLNTDKPPNLRLRSRAATDMPCWDAARLPARKLKKPEESRKCNQDTFHYATKAPKLCKFTKKHCHVTTIPNK